MTRILITGATGFVGGHLVRALLARGFGQITGVSLRRDWPADQRDLADRVRLVQADLCDQAGLTAILRDAHPDAVYHLAGYADAGKSFQEPDAAWRGNLHATRSLFDALRATGLCPRVVSVGTGMIYGGTGGADGVLDERSELRPDSPYAASKAAADLLGYQYFRAHGLPIVRVRPFNHAGPGQSPAYAISSFARQAARIERGEQEAVIRAGNLEARRDFTDVRDVVRAYILLMEKGEPGEAYHVASGRTVAIREVLDLVGSLARVPLRYQSDPQLVRGVETPVPLVSIRKLRECTGWLPERTLAETVADTLEYWRTSVPDH